VPPDASGNEYRLMAYINNKLYGASNVFSIGKRNNNDNPFEINDTGVTYVIGSERIIKPRASTTWYIGQMIDVSWNFKSEGNISLELYKNGRLFKYFDDYANNLTSIDFIRLSDNIVAGHDYQIKISDTRNRGNYLISEKFSINEKEELYSKENNYSRPKRSSFAGRNINYIEDLTFSGTNLTIYAWDHGQIDGDIISLYLNGKPIIQDYTLTGRKQSISVTLDPFKPNDLFLYAENTGEIYPNTVALDITDGIINKRIELKSNMSSCEGIVIHVR